MVIRVWLHNNKKRSGMDDAGILVGSAYRLSLFTVIIKRLQVWALLWLGRRLFAFVKTWAPKENQAATVMHFAHSERDFNTAARQHVEELDACDHQYAERLGGVKCIKCGHFVGNWE